jgi:hypothetical protein
MHLLTGKGAYSKIPIPVCKIILDSSAGARTRKGSNYGISHAVFARWSPEIDIKIKHTRAYTRPCLRSAIPDARIATDCKVDVNIRQMELYDVLEQTRRLG